MTNLPISIPDAQFAPALDPPPQRKLSWIGHTVEWVRSAKNYSVLYRASITALAIFACIALIFSGVGILLYIPLQREFDIQEQFDSKLHLYKRLYQQVIENGRHQFIRALKRCHEGPIDISPLQRNQMLEDLNIPRNEGHLISNNNLLTAVAAKFENYRLRYNLAHFSSDA